MTAEAIPPSSADQAALSVRSRRLRRVAVATAVPAGAIGVLGIIGWVSGASTVVFVPRAVTIVPFIAVAVLLLALSLGLLVMVPPRRLTTQAVRVVAAALPLASSNRIFALGMMRGEAGCGVNLFHSHLKQPRAQLTF